MWNCLKLTFKIVPGLFMISPIASESFLVYEGDTLTVMGLLKFDQYTDTFNIDNPTALFLGGRDELVMHLKNLHFNLREKCDL